MGRKAGKNISKSRAAVEKRQYLLHDAVPLLQKVKFAKFDETVEVTPAWASIPNTPTRWCAGRWSCRTGWANQRRCW